MLPPKNESECLDLISMMEAHYGTALEGFEEDDIFYEGQLDQFIETPAGVDVTIPVSARAVVDEAVDNAAPQDIMVFYPPRGIGDKPEKDADAVRRYIRGLWQYWRTEGNDIDIIRDFQKNLFRSGKACFKLAIDWTLWPTMSELAEANLREAGGAAAVRKRAEEILQLRSENTPMFCRSIPPACIMEDPTVGGRKLWVIERYQSSVMEVANLYSQDVALFREFNWTQELPVYEIWSASYVDHEGNLTQGKHFVFVNNTLIVEEDNPYHDLPYEIKYSGYGRESYEGKPEHKAVGLYTRQNKSMFLAEARRFTHFDAIMTNLAYPVGFMPDDVDTGALSFAPGAINFVPSQVLENLDKLWVSPKIPEAEYLGSLQAISNQIERGTVQRALRGAGVPGTDSAAQYNALTQQSKLRIDSAVQATEQAMSAVSSKVLRFIDQVLQDRTSVFIAEENTQEYTVGPKQIRGRYRVGIRFKPNEEAEKERKLILATDAITKGALSPYDAYLNAGFENPKELIARKLAYDLLEEPLIKRYMAKKALQDWGEDAEQIELEEQMAQGEQALILRDFMNMLQSGSLPNVGDPMSPNGVPVPNMPIGGGGGTPPQGGTIPLPAGAPPAIQSAPVAAAVQDINSVTRLA